MKQTKEEIELSYQTPDPWRYQTTPADIDRKRIIVELCKMFAPKGGFNVALDVACGEGWITQDLPAQMVFGYELSDAARARFPMHVIEFSPGAQRSMNPLPAFDLVTCMGALYKEYDYAHLIDVIKENARDVIVITGIRDWELAIDLEDAFEAREVFKADFPYARPESLYVQRLRVFKK